MLRIDVIDKIIPEPIGGAHRHHLVAINNTGDEIEKCLNVLSNQHGNELKHSRQERYLQIGRLGLFSEKTTTANEVLDSKFGKSRPQKLFYSKQSFFKNILGLEKSEYSRVRKNIQNILLKKTVFQKRTK